MKKLHLLKRTIALLTILALLLSFAACGKEAVNKETGITQPTSAQTEATSEEAKGMDPFGKYDPMIKMTTINLGRGPNDTLPEGQTVKDNVWTRAYKEQLGIEVDVLFEAFQGNEARTKMNLLMATGDLPDVFGVEMPMLPQLIKANQIMDITQVYNDYASPELKEMYNTENGKFAVNAVTRDGKMWGIPAGASTTEDTQMLYIRKDWLDKLSLELPKTLDDVIKICEAFVKQDPDGNGKNDTYGLGFYKTVFTWEVCLTGFFNAFHAYPNTAAFFNWIEDGQGGLMPGIKQPEVKLALAKLQEMYKDGLIDPEFMVKDGNNITEDVTQSKIGIYFGGTWEPDWRIKPLKQLNPDSDWVIMRIPSVDDKPAMSNIQNTQIFSLLVVNSKYKNPEAVIKVANLGIKLKGEDYAKYIQDSANNRVSRVSICIPEIEVSNGWEVSKTILNALKTGDESALNDFSREMLARMNKWYNDKDPNEWGAARIYGYDSTFEIVTQYADMGLLKRNEFFGEPGDAWKKYFSSLRDKEYEVITKIIAGQSELSAWDEFLQYWDAKGGKQMEDEVNAWYKEVKNKN